MFITKVMDVIYRLHDNTLNQHIVNSPHSLQITVKQ